MMNRSEHEIRERIVAHGASLHQRGLVPGNSGNISVRLSDGILLTPTNSCLGRLDPARISKIDLNGQLVSGDPPSKEGFLHLAFYRRREFSQSVVHLHSPRAVAVSCLRDLDGDQPIKPLTPYFVMQIGNLRLLPYYPPGDQALADAVDAVADRHHALLLANHGPIVAGTSLDAAVAATEELEAAAGVQLDLSGRRVRELTCDEIDDLRRRFPARDGKSCTS